LRRDFATLISLISAHALLHRETRAKDDKGRILATIHDYDVVQALVAALFAEGVEATVPPTVRATVEAVKAIGSPETSLVVLAKRLGLDKSSVRARVRKAIERGYLINNETREKQPARIALGDPLPNEVQILPSPEVLRKYSGAEGRETEGMSSRDTEPDEASSDEEEKSGKLCRIDEKSAAETEKSAEDDQKSTESSGDTLAGGENGG
jgi:DNA-binding Lrp family transcriptional regulator